MQHEVGMFENFLRGKNLKHSKPRHDILRVFLASEGLLAQRTYEFAVTSVDGAGNESIPGRVVRNVTYRCDGLDVTSPTPPTDITLYSFNCGKVPSHETGRREATVPANP